MTLVLSVVGINIFEFMADVGDCKTEREVKKANRELSSLLSNMEGPLSRLEVVQKKYTELLAEMKRTERDHQKAKKRGDQLQKEKDSQRSELNKVTTMRDKLDKLSRDFAKENKKLKVRSYHYEVNHEPMLMCFRMSLTKSRQANRRPERIFTISSREWWRMWRTALQPTISRNHSLHSIWSWMNCTAASPSMRHTC
jgi:hypothetical protein